jgi:hydrogenase/urease accessory protein HupE
MSHRFRLFGYRLFFLCCLSALPTIAFAHTPIKGINNFYNGLLHPVLVPAQLLLLIAVGLFFGQQGPKENQAALMTYLAATALGLFAAWFSTGVQIEVIILASAATLGLLIALSLRVSLYWRLLIGAAAGFVLGLDSAQETLFGKDRFVALFGSGVGIYFFSLYPMGFADYFQKRPWQKIGVRVIGSWLAASSLLVLALSLSPIKQ